MKSVLRILVTLARIGATVTASARVRRRYAVAPREFARRGRPSKSVMGKVFMSTSTPVTASTGERPSPAGPLLRPAFVKTSAMRWLMALVGLFATAASIAAPAIAVDPSPLSTALAPGQSAMQPLSIQNRGSDLLTWQVLDQNTVVRDFHREAALTLNPSEYLPASAVVDPAGRYAYFGTGTPPGQVVKVDLQTLERIGAVMLPGGEGEEPEKYLYSAVIDPAGRYAYFGTGTYPGKVVKIDLQSFERVSAITLEPGEEVLRAAVIDPAGQFAYFGTDSFPAHVVKIDLGSFERVGALDLNEGILTSAVMDPAGQFAYFGLSVGFVAKVDLASFTLTDSIYTGVGTVFSSALIDAAGQFAYFGTDGTDPGQVVKLDLANFSPVDTLTLQPGEAWAKSAAISADGAFAYFGTGSDRVRPARVVKIDLANFTRAGAITLNEGEDQPSAAVIAPNDGSLYFATSTFPGRIVKVGDVARNCELPGWVSVTPDSGSVGGGSSQTVDVGFDASGLAVRRHEAALCLQSNDPATPRVAVPLTAEVRLTEVLPSHLSFDVVREGQASSSLSIVNHGGGTLAWTIAQADPVQGCATPATAPWLSLSPTAGSIATGGTAQVAVAIDAIGLAAGPYAAQLCVTATGGADTQTLAVPVGLGVREPAPAAAVAPGSLSPTLAIGESGNWDLSIGNYGTAALDWTLSSQSVAPRLDGFLPLQLDGDVAVSGDIATSTAVIDVAGRYAYFGTSASPAQIVKVDLSTFAHVGVITLAQGEDRAVSSVIDAAGRYAYFGTHTTPGRVVRIDLESFQRVDAVTLVAGEDHLWAALIDPAGAFAYFGTRTDPGKIVKIDLANFTRVGAIDLDGAQGEHYLASGVIDRAGAFAYFGTGPSVGKVVKIDLTNFQRVGNLPLADGSLSAAMIDPTGKFAYFGSDVSNAAVPAKLVKLDLEQFRVADTIELSSENLECCISAAVIDPHGRFAYLASSLAAATRLVEIDLRDFGRVGAIRTDVVENGLFAAVIDPAGRYAYFGGPLYVGNRVLRVEHRLQCALPDWLRTSQNGGSVAAGGTESLTVGASTASLAPAVHTADLCFASNDPAQPLLDVPVRLTVTEASEHIFADGFDSPAP